MQNKGLVKLFGLLFGLVSIYSLSYTFVTNKVEKEAAAFAATKIADTEDAFKSKRDSVTSIYLDSIGNTEIFGYTSYNEAKEKELNKGLDLKGGINVTLQISVKDILTGLANKTKNPIFGKALDAADVASKNSDKTYLDLFFEAFDTLKGSSKLSDPEFFGNLTLSEDINNQMTDAQVQPIIRTKIDESIESAFEVLRKRIDGLGVTQPNIQREGTSGRILVELPGAKDIARAKNLISSTAQLEFWETYPPNTPSLTSFLIQANEELKSILDIKQDTTSVEETNEDNDDNIDDLLSDADEEDAANLEVNPLLDILSFGSADTRAIATAAVKDTAKISSYLKNPRIIRLLPADIKFTPIERISQELVAMWLAMRVHSSIVEADQLWG